MATARTANAPYARASMIPAPTWQEDAPASIAGMYIDRHNTNVRLISLALQYASPRGGVGHWAGGFRLAACDAGSKDLPVPSVDGQWEAETPCDPPDGHVEQPDIRTHDVCLDLETYKRSQGQCGKLAW